MPPKACSTQAAHARLPPARPWTLWTSPRLEDKRAVLKLAFADQLVHVRNEGFRTANLTLPFEVLSGLETRESDLARPERLELPTSWFVAMRSIQLSYGRVRR